jgi:predicted TPR repeat methyltransferase
MMHNRLFLILLLFRYLGLRISAQPAIDIFAKANDLYTTDKAAAIALYDEAIRLDPAVYAFWTNLGHARIDMGDTDGAIVAYQTALRLHPTHAKNHYNLGRAYQTQGEGGLAVGCYDRALALDTTMVNAHYNKALALQEEGDLDGALVAYQHTLLISPTHREARLNLCNVWFAQGDTRTEHCYQQVVADNPLFVRAIVNLAAYYQATLPVSEPTSVPALSASSSTSSNEQQKENDQERERDRVQKQAQRALSLYQQALAMDPHNTMARHGVASIKQLITHPTTKTGTNTDTAHSVPLINSGTASDPLTGSDTVIESVSLDPAYVRELFDSYSFHFDQSLAQLEYRSHLLVGEAVGRYIHLGGEGVGDDGGGLMGGGGGGLMGGDSGGRGIMGGGAGGGGGGSLMGDDEGGRGGGSEMGDDGMILGLDLGAGTGLACGPIKAGIAKAILRRRDGPISPTPSTPLSTTSTPSTSLSSSSPGQVLDTVPVTESGTIDPTIPSSTNGPPSDPHGPQSAAEEAAWERVGVVGVDLSPKMLLKAGRRGCYGDLVTADVVGFVREYADRVGGGGVGVGVGVGGDGQCSTTEAGSSATSKTATTEASTTTAPTAPTTTTTAATATSRPLQSLSPDTHPLLDFVVAADVFMYLGDLLPVLTATRGVLKAGGIVVFTVEALGEGGGEWGNDGWGDGEDTDTTGAVREQVEREVTGGDRGKQSERTGAVEGGSELSSVGGYALQPSGRIAHSRGYVEEVVRGAGLVVREVRREVPRRDRGRAVRGYLVVAERGGVGDDG